MTTATDWEPGTWTDTGSHAIVTDVQALDGAATDPRFAEMPADQPLTQDPARLAQRIASLETENDRLQQQLAALRAQADPLTALWLPDVDPPTLWTEETLIAQWAAAHRDSYDVGGLMADSHRRERQAVDSLLDYTEQVTAHAPADVWDDALRALTDPVEVDYSYRQSEAGLYAEMVVTPEARLWAEEVSQSPEPKAPTAAADALPVSAEGEAFLAQGPAPDESMPGQAEGREALDKLKRRVPTALTATPERQVQTGSGDRLEPDGWVEATWWRRALARIVRRDA